MLARPGTGYSYGGQKGVTWGTLLWTQAAATAVSRGNAAGLVFFFGDLRGHRLDSYRNIR
jgi:hypothetical protein